MGTKRRRRDSKPGSSGADHSGSFGRRRDGRRLAEGAAVCGLLTVHFLLAVSSIRDKTCTYDEVAHLTRGYSWWRLDDMRLTPNHPPLAHAWAALPLLDDHLKFPSLEQKAWYESDVFSLGKQFLYRSGNDPDAMLGQARTMIALLSVALGAVVFCWAKRLFSTTGGFVALVLYTFSPTVLASARLVTTDLCVSLFFMLAIGGVWWFLHRVSLASVLCSTAALAGLFISKMSAVLIIPMGLGLLVVRLLSSRPLEVRLGRERVRQVRRRWQMGLIYLVGMLGYVLVVWAFIWATFGFRYEAMVDPVAGRDRFGTPATPPAEQTVWEFQSRSIPTCGAAIDWARERRLLPEAYLYGFLYTMQAARGREAFLDGERRLLGWWYFFPMCFLYKIPLPIMGIMLAAVAAVLAKKPKPSGADPPNKVGVDERTVWRGLYRTAPLWVLMGVYWGFAITSNLNIGHRHVLPTLAPMFVLCGAAGAWLSASRRWMRATVGGLLALLMMASLSIWPHYLAYFNTIAGGPSQGYRHLVDSSLDWGQDLPGLKRWLGEHRQGERVHLAYFGTGNARHYGIKARSLPPHLRKPRTGDYTWRGGIYCISATRLQQIYLLKQSRWTEKNEQDYRRLLAEMDAFAETPDDQAARESFIQSRPKGFSKRFKKFQKLRFGRLCACLRQREPDDHVGYSILIYRLTDEQVRAALHDAIPER
ncbi:MAG: glycosyltransferase family 39 protein [bacterium]|nr:glycosyltransferase family 39 protein [bacterium]